MAPKQRTRGGQRRRAEAGLFAAIGATVKNGGVDLTSVHIGAPLLAIVVGTFSVRLRFTLPVIVFATVITAATATDSDDFKLPVPPPPEMASTTDWKALKIAAIVVGSVLGLAALFGTLAWLYRRAAANNVV